MSTVSETVNVSSNWTFDFNELYYFSGSREPWIGDNVPKEETIRQPLSYQDEQELLVNYCWIIRAITDRFKLDQKVTVLAQLLLRRYYTSPLSNDLALRIDPPPVHENHKGATMTPDEARWFCGFISTVACLVIATKSYDVFRSRLNLKELLAFGLLKGGYNGCAAMSIKAPGQFKTVQHILMRRERQVAMTVNFDIILTPDMEPETFWMFAAYNIKDIVPQLLKKKLDAVTKYGLKQAQHAAEKEAMKAKEGGKGTETPADGSTDAPTDPIPEPKLSDKDQALVDAITAERIALTASSSDSPRRQVRQDATEMIAAAHRETDLFLRFYPIEIYYATVAVALKGAGLINGAGILTEAMLTEITVKMASSDPKWSAKLQGYTAGGRSLFRIDSHAVTDDEKTRRAAQKRAWADVYHMQLKPVLRNLYNAVKAEQHEAAESKMAKAKAAAAGLVVRAQEGAGGADEGESLASQGGDVDLV